MYPVRKYFSVWIVGLLLGAFALQSAPISLFDGRTLDGWEGETNSVWRIRDGAIVGGSLQGNPNNAFLATTQPYTNFLLQLDYKLTGSEGFVNGGVQFRSRRILRPPNEMSGFQADIGAGFSGCLYDESRRNRMLVAADTNLINRIEKRGEWNHYEVLAIGPQILIFLNGQRTSVWIETQPDIATSGLIALQIHGACKAEISFRNISIEELPIPSLPTEAEILSRFGEGQPGAAIPAFQNSLFRLDDNEVIVFVGQENLVRDAKAGEIEARLARGFAAKKPRFRSMAWESDTVHEQWRDLNFGAWPPQLERAGASLVIAQFGQMESLDGPGRLTEFTAAYHRLLDQFATRTRRLVLLSPMPFEKPLPSHAPDLTQRNPDVAIYTAAIRKIAQQREAIFVDLFQPLLARLSPSQRLTDDGIHLTSTGLREVAQIIANQLGAQDSSKAASKPLLEAIVDKNRLWYDCWRPANWSFVYGDRISQLYGKAGGLEPSLKESFERSRPLIASAETRIHALARGEIMPAAPTLSTSPSPTETTHPTPTSPKEPKALSPEEELATFTLADGYEINLFASELDGVVKPTQIAWDERGRLIVACSPTYPQSKASAKPADYVVILHDTDGDGKADSSRRFAQGLTMVQGIEPGENGLFVCDFDQIIHLRDRDGDGTADERKVIFSGFGVGDTHQLVNSITHGPDGSLWFTQGLHAMSRVETPWGIARLDRSAVWRMRPRSLRLDGFFGGGMAGANCWGVAFDDYGQVFHKSGDRPHGYWTVPGMVRSTPQPSRGSPTSADASYALTPEQYHPIGALFESSPKTTALDFIGTRALPESLQGCVVIGGYYGAVVEVHRLSDAGSGFKSEQLPKLVRSSTSSFRPVDVSVGPDGAIYIADWFNPIIGHYQASYADPRRDKSHGRIWRVSAKGRPSVKQPDLTAMTPSELLGQLSSNERWTRSQAKRLLFDAPTSQTVKALDQWAQTLNSTVPNYDRLLLDATGVYESHETVRPKLLNQLLNAQDPRVRAYGTRVVGAWSGELSNGLDLLHNRVRDTHPRVRLEAVVAASYAPQVKAIEVITAALDSPLDPFLDYAIRLSARAKQAQWAPLLDAHTLTFGGSLSQIEYLRKLAGTPRVKAHPGQTLYEMACLPCHQPEGKGLLGVYPPLVNSEFVRGDSSRLIRVVLHGLSGPITVAGEVFGGADSIPMPSMGGLSDQQISDILSYVRKSFGQGASEILPNEVQRVRAVNIDRQTPWTITELGK